MATAFVIGCVVVAVATVAVNIVLDRLSGLQTGVEQRLKRIEVKARRISRSVENLREAVEELGTTVEDHLSNNSGSERHAEALLSISSDTERIQLELESLRENV